MDTDGELRLLIDSLLFSRHVPYSQCKELVEKLESLSNVYFRSRVRHIFRMPEDRADNRQIFLNIELLDEPVKPYESLRWTGGRPLDLAEYMKKHVYMYSSDDRRVKLRIVRPMVSDAIDMFGSDVTFSDEDKTHVTVTVHANEMSVEQFARSFAPDVIVLEPKAMADKLAAELERTLAIYRSRIDKE